MYALSPSTDSFNGTLAWLDYDLKKKSVVIYDSGNKPWSTTNIETAAPVIVKVLHKPDETKNRAVFVASFTVSQRQVLAALEEATTSKWEVKQMTSAKALKKAADMGDQDHSEGLKLLCLMLMYAEDADRGSNFEKDGVLDNQLLGLPEENLNEVIQRVVKN